MNQNKKYWIEKQYSIDKKVNEGKKIGNLPIENPFLFTDYIERKEEGVEIDLGLIFLLAE